MLLTRKRLSEISIQLFQEMSSCQTHIKAVLIDLSGTLNVDKEPTSGAVDALKRLRTTGVTIKFITNTTNTSRRFLHERLTLMGFEQSADEIVTSVHAARKLISERSLKPFLLVDDDVMEDFTGLAGSEREANAVVVGLAPNMFSYEKLNSAFRLLLNGAELIAIHEGRYYKRADGLALGPGPFVKALEYAGNCTATVLGKPSPDFFASALNDVHPEEAVMIGDDVRDDIGGAQSVGMRGFLVKTGKYRSGDEALIQPPPYSTVANFAAAVNEIIKEIDGYD